MTVRRVYVVALVGCLIGLLITHPVRAQEETRSCSVLIDEAQSRYLNGSYDAAIQLASACLEQTGVRKEHAVAAYRIVSLAHLKQDELDAARAAIVNLLNVAPGYEADPVEDPPTYVSMVAIVRQDIQPQGPPAEEGERAPFFKRRSTWIALGGALLAGGVVAFFSVNGGSGGGGAEPLPPPPGTP